LESVRRIKEQHSLKINENRAEIEKQRELVLSFIPKKGSDVRFIIPEEHL